MKYPFPVVEVRWIDAETTIGWETPDETDHAVPEVMTVGFLIHSDGDSVTIASTACAERNTNARLKIPRGMIKTMKQIRKAGQ